MGVRNSFFAENLTFLNAKIHISAKVESLRHAGIVSLSVNDWAEVPLTYSVTWPMTMS